MPQATVLTRPVERQRVAALLRREATRRLRERLQALGWFRDGIPAVDVAATLGRGRPTVAACVERSHTSGLRGLRQVGRGPGRRATLQARHRTVVARWIRPGPRACGDGVNRWSGKRLAPPVAKTWDLRLSEASIRRLLHQRGAPLLRPRHPLPTVPAWRRRETNGSAGGS